jgi:ribosome-associated protein
LSIIETSLEDDQAIDVITIDLKGKSSLGDYMLIASGRSVRHVGAIAGHLLKGIKAAGFGTAQSEGLRSADWILIDTGDIIVHLFRPEVREFYNLEKMWSPSLIDSEDGQNTVDNLETAS